MAFICVDLTAATIDFSQVRSSPIHYLFFLVNFSFENKIMMKVH